MADPVVFKNAHVEITTSTGSDNFTDFASVKAVKSVEMPFSKAELANGVMSDDGEVFFPGLISAPVSLTLRQGFDTNGVDETAWDLWNNETAFRLQIAPKDETLSASNPAYLFSKVRVFGIQPISGQHGQLLENVVQIRMQSGCTITRRTASAS